ncbi:MAG: CpsD/CapB family tyrosine-protein kinase [Halanaerobiales bacterium]|nr:CpsD/CapB family tyrosine-protein kinase [Halanaerobiales bacterium]
MFKIFKKNKGLNRQILKSRRDDLIVHLNPKSPVAEAYRGIRTNLSFISPDRPLQTLLITSSGAAEGKSMTLVNLAISIAQGGKRVMIIDADLRKPMQHKFFDLTNFSGLSNILTGEDSLEDELRETGIEGVSLLSTGVIPPNPSELLSSKRMENLLEAASRKVDLVLIDAPPVMPVADAVILGSKVDGVVLVVASNRTHQQMLLKTRENLDRVNARIIGTIFNWYPLKNNRSNYNYYHYYSEGRKVGRS